MKRVITLLTAVFALALATPAAASPPQPSGGTFSVLTAIQTDSKQANGNTFVTVSRTAALTGTYTGTTTDIVELVIHKDGSVNLRGEGVCTCEVDGRVGTFDYRFQGRGPSAASVKGHYVIRHGTGGLEGLHAEGPFAGTLMAVAYGGQHHFDPE